MGDDYAKQNGEDEENEEEEVNEWKLSLLRLCVLWAHYSFKNVFTSNWTKLICERNHVTLNRQEIKIKKKKKKNEWLIDKIIENHVKKRVILVAYLFFSFYFILFFLNLFSFRCSGQNLIPIDSIFLSLFHHLIRFNQLNRFGIQ